MTKRLGEVDGVRVVPEIKGQELGRLISMCGEVLNEATRLGMSLVTFP